MLKITGLNKTYGNGVKAIDSIDLCVKPGKMFGLLGPNGAGKSSLIRTIATLQKPDTGSIYFNDVDILADPAYMRQHLGYLPQEFSVYPDVSAWDLLTHFATLKGVPASKRRETVTNLLGLVHLFDQRDKAVSTYSGGMARRFGIAQALLGDPKIIIVDEPTAGLDLDERHRFNSLLANIGKEVVVILSTHLVEDIGDLCSEMAVIRNGAVALHGEPHKFTADLQGKIWRKEIDEKQLEQVIAGNELLVSRYASGKLVVDVYNNQEPEGFDSISPELQHVYFHIVGSEG